MSASGAGCVVIVDLLFRPKKHGHMQEPPQASEEPTYCREIGNNHLVNIESIRMFVKVAELASFTRAAEHLGLSKTRVSTAIAALETKIRTRLLQRSTRAVRLTSEGERFLAHAQQLVADADELVAMFQTPSTLRGRVCIDMPQGLARSLFIPRLAELYAAHPHLDLQLSTTDRRVDVIREGFDCVVSVGKLTESATRRVADGERSKPWLREEIRHTAHRRRSRQALCRPLLDAVRHGRAVV